MFRNLRKVRRKSTAGRRQPARNAEYSRSNVGQFEKLEERYLLAWVGFFDGITLDLVQTVDDGDVTIDNSGLGGAFRTTDNSGSLTFVDAQNVTVTMLDNTANQLNFEIETTHTGNVTLNLGHGPRDIVFSGFGIPGIANTVGGNFTVNAGNGPQFVNLAPVVIGPVPFQTGGSATFNLGDGFDTVYNNENFVIIGGDLRMTGVNLFRYTDFLFPAPLNADLKVGGDLVMDTSNEDTESFLLEGGTFHDTDEARSIISGDFIYIGGENIDHINLNDTYIQGNVNIDLGLGTPFFGDPQNVTTTLTLPLIFGGPTAQIDGNISITAGDSNLGNVITLDGEFFGNTVTYNGGDLVDQVSYGLLGGQADVRALMGGGDDLFVLSTDVNVLDIDFGNDIGDVFDNQWGQFTFDSDITNFQWFDHLYTQGDDRLVMNQLADTGDIVIDNDGGITGIDWRLFTGLGGVASTTPADSLELNMLNNTGNVEMDLINPVIAFLTLNLGNGDRNVDFTGTSNNPLRDLVISANVGDQNVALSTNAALAVATLDIDLGVGFDTVDENGNDLIISEDLFFRGVNVFENDGILSVTGMASIGNGFEVENSVFANNTSMNVGGRLTYTGGAGRDEVRLNGVIDTNIGSQTIVDLGDNITGGTQSVLLDNPNASIGGSLLVDSTSAVNPDSFVSVPGAVLGGNVVINFGDGPNTAVIGGTFIGISVLYVGGNGVDDVTFGTTGNPANVNIKLRGGDDTFTLLAGANINPRLRVDFGSGNDVFTNNFGPFTFDTILLNLDGFNRFYDVGPDQLRLTQVADTGLITIDNNGAGNSIRLINTVTTEMAPASNVRLNLLPNSSTNVRIDYDSPQAGNTILDLKAGNRNVNFIGTSNQIGGFLRIEAGDGVQNVTLAVNADLHVTGSTVINLRDHSDIVDDGANNVNVGSHFILRGVNTFINDNTLTIGGNLTMNTSFDAWASILENLGTMNVSGRLNYIGGGAVDDVLLAGANIGDVAVINLGTSFEPFVLQDIDLRGSTLGNALRMFAGSSAGGNLVLTDAATTVGGDVTLNFAATTTNNNVTLLGTYSGTYGTYRGGSGVDNVVFGATAPNMNFVTRLGASNDSFELQAAAFLMALLLDGNAGNDTFIDGIGPPYPFPVTVLNIP